LPWWTVGAGTCSGPAGPNGHSGCGEQFWNCADIKVLPGNGLPIATNRTTQAPASTTTTEAMATTTSTTAAATTMPPSSTCRVVNGAADFGATASKCNAVCQMLPAGHWPCGVGHACDCAALTTTTAGVSSTMQVSSTMSETMPETTRSTTMSDTVPETTISSTEAAPSTTAGTVRCFKTLGIDPNGATDANCASCTTKTIWPCNGKDWTVNPPRPICTCTASLAEASSQSLPMRKARRQTFLGTSLLQEGAMTEHSGTLAGELGDEL